jgi:hypothetical protein
MAWTRRRSAPVQEGSGFTPSQMIGLVLAVALLVLAVPIGVKASGSLVTIMDSSTTTKARVDSATRSLRTGGITNKVLDRNGSPASPFHFEFTFNAAPYSQIRIYADSPSCPQASCFHLTVGCIEPPSNARTCLLVPTTPVDQNGYNAVQEVPGRTVQVRVDWPGTDDGPYHVVVYGRAP